MKTYKIHISNRTDNINEFHNIKATEEQMINEDRIMQLISDQKGKSSVYLNDFHVVSINQL